MTHPGGFPSGCAVSMWLLMGGAAYTVVAHIPHASSLRSYECGLLRLAHLRRACHHAL